MAKEKIVKEKAPKQLKEPKQPKVKKPKEPSQEKLEREFNKERAKRLREREKAYRAAKKAGTLDERQMTPEHLRYLRRKRIIEKVWPIFRFLILFGLCFVILYPLIYMISTAFRPSVQMTDPSVIWLPKSLTLNNIIEVWETMEFGSTLLNTVVLNLVCSLLSVVVCAVTGYGFARFNFKGKGILFAIVIMQSIVPPQITVGILQVCRSCQGCCGERCYNILGYVD